MSAKKTPQAHPLAPEATHPRQTPSPAPAKQQATHDEKYEEIAEASRI